MAHLALLTFLLVATMRIGIQSPGEVNASLLQWYQYTQEGTTPEEYDNESGDNEEEPTTIPLAPSATEASTSTTTTTETVGLMGTLEATNAFSLALPDQNPTQYFIKFADFEQKSKSYMDKMKSNLLTVLSSYSNSFHREVQRYIMQSPSNKNMEIIKYSREICDCDGVRMSPCPLKCLYSCYGSPLGDNNLTYYEDCRYYDFSTCECYSKAFRYCDRGESIENCLTTTTETIPGDEKCLDYRIEEKNVSKSFEAISAVLVEPIKKHFRGIETELYYLSETAVSVDHLRTLVSQICSSPSQEEPTCANEASDALRAEISMYRQIKSNITTELLSTQKKIRDVYKSFKTLKEQHFTHISKLFEKHACCLKASDFSIPNFNCPDVIPDLVTNKPGCPQGHFACYNGKCIPLSYFCDGGNDCPGGEDENYCNRRLG